MPNSYLLLSYISFFISSAGHYLQGTSQSFHNRFWGVVLWCILTANTLCIRICYLTCISSIIYTDCHIIYKIVHIFSLPNGILLQFCPCYSLNCNCIFYCICNISFFLINFLKYRCLFLSLIFSC